MTDTPDFATEDNEDENMVLRTIFLPKAMDIRLREEASAKGVSKGEYVRQLLKAQLAHPYTS